MAPTPGASGIFLDDGVLVMFSSPTGEDDVRPAGQVTTMEPEPIAHAVEEPANPQLRLRIYTPDQSHAGAALRGGHDVGHELLLRQSAARIPERRR